MRILNGLKQRIIDRLSDAVQQRLQPPPSPCVATVKPNAVIFPEASIENISGLESHIVIGSDSYIRGRLLVYPNGGSINIGQWCYVGIRTEIWSMASITIGDRVLISHDVNIIDNSGHSKNAAERHAHFRQIVSTGHAKTWAEIPGVTAKPIVIEDDVWISCGAIILQGVRIGARSVIAAGSVVTRDVPPDSIYRCSIMPILKSLVLEASVDLNNA